MDLGTTEANGLAFAVSAQVAGPLLAGWRAAPQPISAAACPAPQPTQQAAPPPSNTPTSQVANYTGRDFSISYPSSFRVSAGEVDKGSYFDTTITGPSDFLIRVDETLAGSSGTIDNAAAPVLRALRSQSGYRELSLRHETFNGTDALRWEFEVPEKGVLLHKVDEFIFGAYGSEWAILTQAPASSYQQVATAFDAIRDSFSER